MRLFLYGFLLTNVAIFAETPALNESTHEISNLASPYQKHLPPDIYEYVIKNGLVDETRSENVKEKQTLEGVDKVSVGIETHKSQQFINISYYPQNKKAEDNFGGIQIGYQDGEVIGYAVFDAEGRDYIAPTPFSRKEEEKAKALILNLFEGGVAKIRTKEISEED